MNIIEFSKILGVSTATVSRAFHEPHKLKKTTLDSILKEARKRRYYPSPMGRALVRQCSDTVGLVWPLEIEGPSAIIVQRILAGITNTLMELDKDLLLCPVERNRPEGIAHAERTIRRGRCDCWIVVYPRTDDPLIPFLQESNHPVVTFQGKIEKQKQWKHVILDQAVWIEDALKRLKHGHAKNVAFIGLRPGEPDYMERLAQFQRLAPKYFSKYTTFLPSWPTSKMDIVHWLKEQRWDAVIGADDRTALATLEACKLMKLKVPDEIQIIGVDDDPASSLVTPRLTTYRQPIEEMAAMAVKAGLKLKNVKMVFSPTFVEGGTIRIN